LQLYGRISRRFEAIAARAGRTHIEVLSDVHGDLGAKWARRREGRIFAVYPRTLAGRRLILKTCDERNPITLAPDERLRNLNDVQGRQPKKWRGELLEQAAQQAKKLYGDACAWWNFSAMLVRESPTESIARALRAAERPPEPIVLRDKHERFDLAARRPASEIFGKGKDGFAAMRRKAEEENEALDALDRRHA
jgi:hypothetical protein